MEKLCLLISLALQNSGENLFLSAVKFQPSDYIETSCFQYVLSK